MIFRASFENDRVFDSSQVWYADEEDDRNLVYLAREAWERLGKPQEVVVEVQRG